jgi:MICOS complex subunit MIC26
LSSYFGSLEERYLPKVAEKHAIANAHAKMTWERVKESTREGREWMGKSVEWSVRRVQESTGLKLRDVVGGGTQQESKSETRKAD